MAKMQEMELALFRTDPKFADFLGDFAFEKVPARNGLDGKTRFLIVLATPLGCQALMNVASSCPWRWTTASRLWK